MKYSIIQHHKSKQEGAMLVVCILLLMVLTMISISSITTTILQEKTTANSYNTQLAFQASEASLRAAEEYLRELSNRPTPVSTCLENCEVIWDVGAVGALYGGESYQDNWWATANSITNNTWWNTYAYKHVLISAPGGVKQSDTLSYVASQPGFIAEELAFIPDDLNPNTRAAGMGLNFYRITSRGTGGEQASEGNNPAQVMVQSVFSKRFNQ